jgi:hypothetical protein
MKFICFAILFSLITVSNAQNSANAYQLKNIEWLLGEWKRTNPGSGKSGLEKWTKTSESEFKGIGLTMKGKDTSFIEKLKIVFKDGYLFYVAEVPG